MSNEISLMTHSSFALLTIGFSLLISGCNTSPAGNAFTVTQGGVTHVEGCNVAVHRIETMQNVRRVRVQYACGVTAPMANDAKWWGDQPQPLMFTVDLGDCMLMQETYYCLEDFRDGVSVTFRPMYKKPKHPLGNLERIH